VFNVSAGEGGLEPIQLGVRSVIERAVLEMMANLYGAPGPDICLDHGDPLGGGTLGVTGAFTPAYNNLDHNNGQTRAETSRWEHPGDADASDRGSLLVRASCRTRDGGRVRGPLRIRTPQQRWVKRTMLQTLGEAGFKLVEIGYRRPAVIVNSLRCATDGGR